MSKIILPITSKDLSEIVNKVVTRVLNEGGYLKESNISTTEPMAISTDDLRIVDVQPKDFNLWYEKVWNMLIDSYSNVGGLKTYRNYNDFCDKKHGIKVVLDNYNNLLACATYRKIEGSLKMVAIGCQQNSIGKEALQLIIKDNIENFNLFYWAEVSGAIEHYFKKYDGYPIPNTFASEILGVNDSRITVSNTDKVHYDRTIGENGGQYTKMIFGFKNEDIFERVLKDVDNYSDFMKDVNTTISESNKTYTLKQVIYIIENIYRAHEEDGFNELVPMWHEALNDCLKVLHNSEQTETVTDYIGYAEYLLRDMQVLKVHRMPKLD